MDEERVENQEPSKEPEPTAEQAEVLEFPLVDVEASKLEKPPFLKSLNDHAARADRYEGNKLKKAA